MSSTVAFLFNLNVMLLLLGFLFGTPPASVPLCTSCAQFCGGTSPGCSLLGPVSQRDIPYGVRRNYSAIRMTAASVLSITNKNTGSIAGDLTFVLREIAQVLSCRHNPLANVSSGCDAGATPSWLEKQPLVFVKTVVETSGIWGVYQRCNLNVSARDPTADASWHCVGGAMSHIARKNATTGRPDPADLALCKTQSCIRRGASLVGWESKAPPVRAKSNHTKVPPPPQCVAAVRSICGPHGRAVVSNFSTCLDCLGSANVTRIFRVNKTTKTECTRFEKPIKALLTPLLCGAAPALAPACRVAIAQRCNASVRPPGGFGHSFPNTTSGYIAWKICEECINHEVTRPSSSNKTSIFYPSGGLGVCAIAPDARFGPKSKDLSWYIQVKTRACGMQPHRPPHVPVSANDTWMSEYGVNEGKIIHILNNTRGSFDWLSTPGAVKWSECKAGYRPGDGRSNCTWRSVEIASVVNYTCANARLGSAVIRRNPACFARCPESHLADNESRAFPRNPSDCWLFCFFNTLLGNSTLQLKGMTAVDIIQPLTHAFDPETEGGCPDLRSTQRSGNRGLLLAPPPPQQQQQAAPEYTVGKSSPASLFPGDSLGPNKILETVGGLVQLHNQGSDGNIVLQDLHHAIWSTKTENFETTTLELTKEGVLRVVAKNGTVVWTPPGVLPSQTASKLVVQDDCNLVLYEYGNSQVLWSSKSKCITPTPMPPPQPPAPMPPPKRAASSTWFVLGDWGGGNNQPSQRTLPDQLRDASGMAMFARESSLDFVVGVGDNFYPAGVTDVDDVRFRATFEDAYNEPELDCPWFHLAGNHDHRGNVSAQLLYSTLQKGSGRWNMPYLWYSTKHGYIDEVTNETITTQVLMIDTTVLWGLEEIIDDVTIKTRYTSMPGLEARAAQQLEWLAETMANSTADYLWIAGHYPIYDPHSVDPRKRDALVPLMVKYNASGYLAGHCHTMQHFDSVHRVSDTGDSGSGFAFVVSGCGKECNNPAQPTNATAAWGADVVQSYRYSPNSTGTKVNSSFVAMVVGAEATKILYISDEGETMFEAKPVKRRQWSQRQQQQQQLR